MAPFGKLLRQERKETGMLLGELADRLGVSTPYLSQLETGARSASSKMLRKIIEEFKLNQSDAEAMTRAAAASKPNKSDSIIIDISGATISDRALASHLALSFNRLSPEAKRRLREMLKDPSNG
jgi:transcriptional regulator with XRE-family HTH domain